MRITQQITDKNNKNYELQINISETSIPKSDLYYDVGDITHQISMFDENDFFEVEANIVIKENEVWIHIDELRVDESIRLLGLGTEILVIIQDIAKQNNCNKIKGFLDEKGIRYFLKIDDNMDAILNLDPDLDGRIRFYLKNGFSYKAPFYVEKTI